MDIWCNFRPSENPMEHQGLRPVKNTPSATPMNKNLYVFEPSKHPKKRWGRKRGLRLDGFFVGERKGMNKPPCKKSHAAKRGRFAERLRLVLIVVSWFGVLLCRSRFWPLERNGVFRLCSHGQRLLTEY